MTIGFRNAASASAASGGTATATKPTGVVDGDVLLAFGTINSATGAGNWSAPAGWTLARDTNGSVNAFVCWWKLASGEGANYAFSNSQAGAIAVIISAYSGAASVGIPNAVGTWALKATGQSNLLTGTVAPGVNLCTIVACWAGTGAAARSITTNPSGFTNRALNNTQITAQIYVDDEIGLTPAALVAAQTLVISANLTSSAGILVALAPPAPPTVFRRSRSRLGTRVSSRQVAR